MKRYCSILTVVVCILLLQFGCQEEAVVAGETKHQPAVSKSAISPAETENATEPNEAAPKITFEKVVHNFGGIGPGSRNACEFKFTNTGDGLLKVNRKIKATCGCTVPRLSKEEYAPGESGVVKVTYRAGSRTGSTRKSLYVHSNDKNNPKVKLVIRAKIVKRIDYKPKKLKLMVKDENTVCPNITINSLDNRAFAITGFKSTANCITADVNSSIEKTEFVLQPKIDIERLRKGVSGNIKISLTHPEVSTVTIAFESVPKFEIKPKTIVVFNVEPQKPVKKELWILSNYNEDFEVESASSKKGLMKVLSQKKVLSRRKEGNHYKFELEITPPAAENKTRFTDVFFVNIKGGERLQINCSGFYARNKKKH